MKHKVSFFLGFVGTILMLSGLSAMLLGDKTTTSGALWTIGVVFVVASFFPLFTARWEK